MWVRYTPARGRKQLDSAYVHALAAAYARMPGDAQGELRREALARRAHRQRDGECGGSGGGVGLERFLDSADRPAPVGQGDGGDFGRLLGARRVRAALAGGAGRLHVAGGGWGRVRIPAGPWPGGRQVGGPTGMSSVPATF